MGSLALAGAALVAPAMARAASLDPGAVFANAAPVQKAVILALGAATVAAVAIAARKVAAGPRLAGGSAFISGLRFGAPIAGVFGGAFALFRVSLGIANVQAATLKMLAPGLAEAASVAALGFLCGVIAVALHWAIEARIDREVLRA
jgi:biopolymer transport protein ExbB/TolQ